MSEAHTSSLFRSPPSFFTHSGVSNALGDRAVVSGEYNIIMFHFAFPPT